MEPELQTVINSTRGREFFRKPHNATLCFAMGMLLFFLPFAEFKCGNMSLLGNTGIGIAIGQQWKVTAVLGKNEFMKKLDESSKTDKELMKDGPNIFAIVALVAGLFGIIIAFTKVRWRVLAGMCAGILGAVMLLALLIQYKLLMRSMLSEKAAGEGPDFDVGGILKLQFTFWYYLSLLSFIAAAFFNYMKERSPSWMPSHVRLISSFSMNNRIQLPGTSKIPLKAYLCGL